MENKNYQIVLDNILKDVSKLDRKPSLLLHVCCGPCSSYVLEYLSTYFEITILFYNPNIYPKEEYIRRKEEMGEFVSKAYPNTKYIIMDYNEKEFYDAVRGYEHLGERSERCFNCYELRLKKTVEYAKENGYDYFTTSLSISPYKVSSKLNEIGSNLEKEYGINYLYSDFKKKNGYKRSIEISKEYNMYRQEYCGCVYSKVEREKYENR